MRPREHRNVTLVMLNRGEGAEFLLTVNTAVMGSETQDFLEYVVTPATAFRLEQDSSTEIRIEITLSSDVADGLAVVFTVIAESVLNNRISDFVTFSVYTTTRPPPEFTENVS